MNLCDAATNCVSALRFGRSRPDSFFIGPSGKRDLFEDHRALPPQRSVRNGDNKPSLRSGQPKLGLVVVEPPRPRMPAGKESLDLDSNFRWNDRYVKPKFSAPGYIKRKLHKDILPPEHSLEVLHERLHQQLPPRGFAAVFRQYNRTAYTGHVNEYDPSSRLGTRATNREEPSSYTR
jgi:hypothetical protein